MRKLTLLISMLFLSLGMAWAADLKVSGNDGVHYFTITNGNNVKVGKNTVDSDVPGRFAFFAVDGVANAYYIYSLDEAQWLDYTKAAGYSNTKNFVTLSETKGNYFHIEKCANNSGYYQIRPYNDGGVAWKYLNYFQGKDGVSKLGLWEQNGDADAGSRYLFDEVESVTDINGFENGKVYTFVTKRGLMGAKDNFEYVISTAYSNGVNADISNANFHWTVYKSANNKYYLYNIGKGQFMGVESDNNDPVPFVAFPAGNAMTFKKSSNATYPIMFSTDNNGVVNHSKDRQYGLINWADGWGISNDDGSNHAVVHVGELEESALNAIANIVAVYEKLPALDAAITNAESKATWVGNAVGFYSYDGNYSAELNDIKTFRATINQNTTVADVEAKIAALKTMVNSLSFNQPTTGKYYTIVSNHNGYAAGGRITVGDDEGLIWNKDDANVSHWFKFVDAGEGKFYLYNVKTGKYLSTNVGHGQSHLMVQATETGAAVAVTITNRGEANIVKIVPVGGEMIHAQKDFNYVVDWDNDSNTGPSAWTIVEVENPGVAYVDNTNYATLEAAVEAATDGATITLLQGVELTSTVTIEKPITLDLGGNTITGADGAIVFNVKAATTIKNGTILGNKSGTSSGIIDIYANLDMDGVTVETSKVTALRFKAGDCTATLKNCNVTGHFKGYGNSVWNIESGVYKASSTSITEQLNGTAAVSGGTFHYVIKDTNCAPGYAVVVNADGTYTVEYNPVCFIDTNNNGTLDEGEAVYGSLKAVFDTHKSGDVYVVLTKDCVINDQVDTDADAKYYINTNVADGVTVEFAFADDWNYVQKMYIGENVTVKAKNLLAWTELEVHGTINTEYLYTTTANVIVAESGIVNANTGEATVQVKNGATFTVNGTVNTAILNVWAGESELIVSGENAKVNAKWIDIWDGTPAVNIADGATLAVEKIKASRGGSITVYNATLDATSIELGHNGESAGVLTENGNSTITGEIKMTAVGSVVNSDGGLNVTTEIADHKVVFENGLYKVVAKVYVAKIDGQGYETLAEALTAADNNATVELLWAEGDAPIAMNGAVFGKNVTITGTAIVDWSKGFLFVGRGGEGNATVTFDGANLTSASDNASYGIHVSGREKGTNNKYDGTVVIKNSTIVLDYLINKGAMTLDNATLTVKNGFATGGRPASETESGEDATATISLANNSKVVVNNHNGMGLGYEAIGVMNVDATSTFEATENFLVTAKGTMNVAGTVKVAEGKTLTNNGSIVLTAAAATLTANECGNVTTNVADHKVVYADGAYKVVAKVYVAKIGEQGYETFAAALAAAQDGDEIDLCDNVTVTSKLIIDKAVTIDGNGHSIIADANTVWYTVSGKLNIKSYKVYASITANATLKNITFDANSAAGGFTVDGANVVLDNFAIKNLMADAVTLNNDANVVVKTRFAVEGCNYAFIDARKGVVTVAEGTIFDMAKFTGNVSPATSDLKGAVDANGNPFFCAYSSTTYYKTLTSTSYSNLTLLADVELANNVTLSGTLNLNGHNLTVAEGKVLEVSGTLAIAGDGELNAAIVLKTNAATLKTSRTDIAVTTNVVDTRVVYEDGTYKVVTAYVAQIGTQGYTTLQAAVEAAQAGETVVVLENIELSTPVVVAADKELTLNLNGKTVSQTKECTASYAMITNNGSLTITGDGKLSFTDTSAGDSSFGWGSYTINNCGTLIVENGIIEHLGAQPFAKHMICAIFQYSGSTTINGGTISTPNYRSVRLWKGDMTINGGTFDGQVWVQAVDESAKLTISGGTFAPSAKGDASSVFVGNRDSQGKLHNVEFTVTNGTFTTKIGCSDAAELAGEGIKGGKFTEAAKNNTNSALLAEGFVFAGEAVDGYYGIEEKVELPAVEVIDIKSSLTDSDPDLTFALNFKIKDADQLTDEYLEKLFAQYGNWYTDYVLTISGLSQESVTFNANGDADGYLAGQYDAYGENWVSVPFEDVTLANGESIYIMEYAAKLMGQTGLRFTLQEIAEIVQNFDCGVYFTPEFMAANPGMKVDLQLKVFTEDAEGNKVNNIDVATNEFLVKDYVAIVHANGKQSRYYKNFADAYAAAEAGETVSLLADLTMKDILVIDKAITLDGNGKTLTSTAGRAINVSGADGATIKNLTINASGERAINVINNATNVTIENVTATAANYTVNVAASAPNAVVAINGSTLNGLCTVNVAAAGANVTVDNSTVNCNDNNTTVGEVYAALCLNKAAVGASIIATNTTVNVTEGSDSEKGRNGAENGTVTINGSTEGVTVTVAVITYPGSDNYYGFTSLADAIEFAKAGDVVTLIRDVTIDELVKIEKAVTIDLNGKKVTSTAKKAFEVYADATIMNGTIEAAQRCVDTRKAVELTLTDVTLIADEYTTHGNPQPLTIGGSENGTEVVMTNVNISAAAGYGIITFVETELTATNSTIGGYNALYVKPGSDESVFNFVDSDLSGSTVGNDVEGNSFSVIAVRANNVTVNVDDASTVTAAGNYSYAISFASVSNGEVATGSSVTIAGTIAGNVLADLSGNAVKVKAEYADELAAAGYVTIEAENGLVAVIKAVAQIGETKYNTLQAAVDAAQAGETITMLCDVELASAVTIPAGKVVTLDLNGKTVSYTSAVVGEDMITNNGNLTIDSSVEGGKITYNNTDTTGKNVTISTISACPGSTLVVNGGTIENTSVGVSSNVNVAYTIDILTNGSLGNVAVTIDGGSVVSTNYIAIRQFNNGTACKNSLTINDGHIYGAKRAVQVHMDNNAAVTAINGGKVEAGEGGYALCNFAATSALEVTGGELIGAVYSASEGFITGGTFSEEPYSGYIAEHYEAVPGDNGYYGIKVEEGYIAELEIIDGEYGNYTYDSDKTVGELTYVRTLPAAGIWYSVFLPFDVPVEALGEDFDVARINDLHTNFNEEDGSIEKMWIEYIVKKSGTLPAGKPFLVRAKSSDNLDMVIELKDVTLYAANKKTSIIVSSVITKITFEGVYASTSGLKSTSSTRYMAVNADGVWDEFDNYSLNPFRVMMTLEILEEEYYIKSEASLSVGARVIGEENEDGTTVIYDVYDEAAEDMIFDLQGRRVLETEKGGIYIKGGKKFIAQ